MRLAAEWHLSGYENFVLAITENRTSRLAAARAKNVILPFRKGPVAAAVLKIRLVENGKVGFCSLAWSGPNPDIASLMVLQVVEARKCLERPPEADKTNALVAVNF